MHLLRSLRKRNYSALNFDWFQRKDGDFRGTVHADRHVHRADAAAHEDRGALALPIPGDHRELPRRDGANPREHDLPAVGMAAEHERHSESGSLGEPHRDVREQDQVGEAPRSTWAMS